MIISGKCQKIINKIRILTFFIIKALFLYFQCCIACMVMLSCLYSFYLISGGFIDGIICFSCRFDQNSRRKKKIRIKKISSRNICLNACITQDSHCSSLFDDNESLTLFTCIKFMSVTKVFLFTFRKTWPFMKNRNTCIYHDGLIM